MATTSRTIYTHTCDLCGAEYPRAELRRFGLVRIGEEASFVSADPTVDGPTVDVCEACQQQPIAEIVTWLADQEPGQIARARIGAG
jgi:hypothetical protein